MSLFALGLNHHTAPLAVRERVVFHVERLGEALGEAKRLLAPEAAILSTCNRTELYLSGELDQAKRRRPTHTPARRRVVLSLKGLVRPLLHNPLYWPSAWPVVGAFGRRVANLLMDKADLCFRGDNPVTTWSVGSGALF